MSSATTTSEERSDVLPSPLAFACPFEAHTSGSPGPSMRYKSQQWKFNFVCFHVRAASSQEAKYFPDGWGGWQWVHALLPKIAPECVPILGRILRTKS